MGCTLTKVGKRLKSLRMDPAKGIAIALLLVTMAANLIACGTADRVTSNRSAATELQPMSPDDALRVYEHVRPAVVEVIARHCTFESRGTGFHVGNGFIVTAARIVNGSVSASTVGIDGVTADAGVELLDADADVAVLRSSGPIGGSLELTTKEDIYGYALVVRVDDEPPDRKYQQGLIATRAITSSPADSEIKGSLEALIPSLPADIGSPFVDMDAKVLGMVTNGGEYWSIGADVQTIRSRLRIAFDTQTRPSRQPERACP